MRSAGRGLLLVSLLGAALFVAAPTVQASPEDGKRLRIELFGGFSTLNPKDLNGRAQFDRLYEDFYTELRYSYYRGLYGNFVSYSGGVDGEFKEISRAMPVGLRLKYELNRALSVSLGFKYLSDRQDSQVVYDYDVRLAAPDAVQFYEELTLFRENSPYSLSVKAYVPMVGVHFRIGAIRFLNLEAFLAAGPLFASCEFMRRRFAASVDSYDYETEVISSLEMSGRGTGLVLEAGLQADLKIVGNLHLLAEVGYAYQAAWSIAGPETSETTTRDSNTAGYTESASSDGKWTMVEGYLANDWGRYAFAYPTSQPRTVDARKFKLDLSGAQLRLGLSFRL